MNEQSITLTFNIEQVNTILRHLDAGAHAQVRQLIDNIINQTNAQAQAQQGMAAPQEAVGGTD